MKQLKKMLLTAFNKVAKAGQFYVANPPTGTENGRGGSVFSYSFLGIRSAKVSLWQGTPDNIISEKQYFYLRRSDFGRNVQRVYAWGFHAQL